MPWALFFLFGAGLFAQTSMPIGIVRGDIVSHSGNPSGGELTVRNASDVLYGCFYDAHTYFERDHHPIAVAGLTAGDPVEIVADRKTGSSNCYARTVQVVDMHEEKLLPGRRPRLRSTETVTESWAPRGDMAFGGTVLRLAYLSVTLRTRNGDQTVVLRPDTRYWSNGQRADSAALSVNTHVFVRAGHDVEGHVEAYQVVWGGIVSAK